MLSFKLSMPNVGSWNGKWTGKEKKHYIILREEEKKENELNGQRILNE